MSDLQNRFKTIINNLEENIDNKKDLDYIKEQIGNLMTIFLDEMDKLADRSIEKMDTLAEGYKVLNDKINNLEEKAERMEKELYVSEWSDFEIVCPYCNHEFIVDLNEEDKNEVQCPECKNIIELDWNEEEGCGGHCDCCHSDCEHDEYDDDDDDM